MQLHLTEEWHKKILKWKSFIASGSLNPNTEAERWKSEDSKRSNSEIATEKRQPRGNFPSNPDDQPERIEPEGKKHSDPCSKSERREL